MIAVTVRLYPSYSNESLAERLAVYCIERFKCCFDCCFESIAVKTKLVTYSILSKYEYFHFNIPHKNGLLLVSIVLEVSVR